GRGNAVQGDEGARRPGYQRATGNFGADVSTESEIGGARAGRVINGNGSAFRRLHDDGFAGRKTLGRSHHGGSEGGIDGDLVVCECDRGRAPGAHSPGQISSFEPATI